MAISYSAVGEKFKVVANCYIWWILLAWLIFILIMFWVSFIINENYYVMYDYFMQSNYYGGETEHFSNHIKLVPSWFNWFIYYHVSIQHLSGYLPYNIVKYTFAIGLTPLLLYRYFKE